MPLDPLDAGFKRAALRSVQSATDALNMMDAKEQRTLSLVAGITDLQSGHGIAGYNREYLEERSRILQIDFDPLYPTWPYEVLSTRATPLVAGQSAAGGYLVGVENQDLVDIFRPYSPLLQSGVNVIGGLESHALLPRVTQDVTGQWLTSETVSATEAPPLLGSIAAAPKTFAITMRWSRQMQLQALNLENSLRQIVAKAAIQGVDTAALTGVGGAGLPLGLLNSGGIGTQSGASYSHANSWTTRGTLAAANVNDAAVTWLGAPGVRTILATRERAAGDEYIWGANDQITGRRANVSTIIPAATLTLELSCALVGTLTFSILSRRPASERAVELIESQATFDVTCQSRWPRA
jgi:HK97 family phage major capsid protein